MNEVNKTLYIPLYGKARVSKKGIILRDQRAEEIWAREQFPLRGKAKSKWLAYFMAMRARVFDEWTKREMQAYPDAMALHIGCGLDGRALRVGASAVQWFDVDFPDVICERKKHYGETERYQMIGADASKPGWLDALPDAARAVVILEGLSMYLTNDEVRRLFLALQKKFAHANVLMDVYTEFGAKASKYKNPINTVGVTRVYGVDSPDFAIVNGGIRFVREGSMTPPELVGELRGFDRAFFSALFAGRATRKIYRLFEYELTRAIPEK